VYGLDGGRDAGGSDGGREASSLATRREFASEGSCRAVRHAVNDGRGKIYISPSDGEVKMAGLWTEGNVPAGKRGDGGGLTKQGHAAGP
jgi:hypothetical protein